MQTGMKIDSKTAECRKFLCKLMDQLEAVSRYVAILLIIYNTCFYFIFLHVFHSGKTCEMTLRMTLFLNSFKPEQILFLNEKVVDLCSMRQRFVAL